MPSTADPAAGWSQSWKPADIVRQDEFDGGNHSACGFCYVEFPKLDELRPRHGVTTYPTRSNTATKARIPTRASAIESARAGVRPPPSRNPAIGWNCGLHK